MSIPVLRKVSKISNLNYGKINLANNIDSKSKISSNKKTHNREKTKISLLRSPYVDIESNLFMLFLDDKEEEKQAESTPQFRDGENKNKFVRSILQYIGYGNLK